jgi:hypothetical protein
MFYHIDQLQYNAKSTRPDPVYVKKLQEVLGGQFGEISVALHTVHVSGMECPWRGKIPRPSISDRDRRNGSC